MKARYFVATVALAAAVALCPAQNRPNEHPEGMSHGAMARGNGANGTAHHGIFSSHRRSVATQLGEASHRRLDSRLETLTGAPNLAALETDAAGFKNLGQFVAAAHVYHNLDLGQRGVTWAQFAAVAQKKSLGKAIQTFDSSAQAKEEAKRAKHQAHEDLSRTGN